MKTCTSYVTMAILAVVGGLTILPAFALQQACPDCGPENSAITAKSNLLKESPITVWTDKSVYDHKSMITIQGAVGGLRPGADVGLVVIGPPPFNNVVKVDQIAVKSDKTFSTSLSTAGPLWKYDGTYTIRVTYGTQEVFDRAIIELTGGISGPRPAVTCAPGELTASGQCIPFTISGGKVTGARINVGTTSLIINVNSIEDGMITLQIPRNVLDAKMGNADDDFFVLVNGEEAEVQETATRSVRTIEIMLPAGTEEIEIIGTFAIPEFGTIAALILAVAIISIIAVTAKTRLNVFPKY